jgi:hypothetical protein
MKKDLIFPIFVAMAGCSTTPSLDFYLVKSASATGMLGAQFRVCESKIRFQGTEFTMEGLVGPNKSATETKSFQVAKLGITQQQAQNISNVALALDSLQRQMCESTRDFALRPGDALEQYVRERDARFERVITALSKAEGEIKKGASQDVVNQALSEGVKAK